MTMTVSVDANGWPTYQGVDGQMYPMKAYTCVHCGRVFGAIIPGKRPNCGECDAGAARNAANRDLIRRIREAYGPDENGDCRCGERDCPNCAAQRDS